jgi:hypothetical protein
MHPLLVLPLMGVFTAVRGFIRTHTFRELGSECYNISVEQSASGAKPEDAEKERWNKAVCKGGELLDAMAGDERRVGNWFKVPKESGESKYQDYSKIYIHLQLHVNAQD